MGKLKQRLSNGPNPDSEIGQYLTNNGFTYDTYVYGGGWGYQKPFSVEDDLYTTWIHVDLINNTLNIYKEYSCGGYIASESTSIPEDLITNDDVEDFMDWLDDETEYYL